MNTLINTKEYETKLFNILEKLSDIYIAIIIILFPLCVDSTGFFKILECKYRYYLVFSVIYITLNVLILLYFYMFHNINYIKKIRLSKIQISVIVFWGINIISCFVSPYFREYNLFVGVGRAEGLITISLYCLTFLIISFFGKFKKIYILYFSISSILINTIAILQYIGFNPLNMYQDGIGTHNVSFMATIGNIDFISAMFCILLTVSFMAYVFLEEEKRYKAIHLISIFMGFFIFIIINVLSGRVAFLAIFALLLPFIITNNKRLARTIDAFSMILLGLLINIIINPEYHYDIGKLKLYIQFNNIAVMFIVVISIFLFLAYCLRKTEFDLSNNKKIVCAIYITMIIFIIGAIIVLYAVNFNNGILYEIHELLNGNFDDNFGTYRVFLWKRAILIAGENFWIGTGPDTFAIRFMDKYTEDIISLGGELSINDTAANVYLTMLVNIGVFGLISYLVFIIFQIVKGIKNKNKYSFVLLITILCYLIQDFFNLWVVIVTPIFWVLMAIHFLSIKLKEVD